MKRRNNGRELHYQGDEPTPVGALIRLIRACDAVLLFASNPQRERVYEAVMGVGSADVLLAEARHLPALASAARQEIEEFDDVKNGYVEPPPLEMEGEPTPLLSIVGEIGVRLQHMIAGLLLVHAEATRDAAEIDKARNAIRRGEAVLSADRSTVNALRSAT
jgi:hypothetical protein